MSLCQATQEDIFGDAVKAASGKDESEAEDDDADDGAPATEDAAASSEPAAEDAPVPGNRHVSCVI